MAGIRAAVVTVSDGVASGTREDASGAVVETVVRDAGFDVTTRLVVRDERDEIAAALRGLCEDHQLIVTTGGTGFGPRDVTPEATRAVIDREAPGLAEAMRAAGLARTPMAALSRAVAGSRGVTLIINLPGSPAGARESLESIAGVVPHAVELLGGATGAHPTGHPMAARATTVTATAVKLHGAPPCAVGNVMSIVVDGEVHGTLGCAEFDEAAVAAAAEVAAAGVPETRTFHHELGDVDVFLAPTSRRRRAVVVSATDVARRLAPLLRTLGFAVTLLEPRRGRVAATDGATFDDVATDLDGDVSDLGPSDVVVATDHDAPGVAETLERVLRTPAGFVGVMGSRRHVGPHVEALRTRGVPEADLRRVRSPLGLDLGGRTPEEIALSIAAGVVAATHERDGGWLDR